MALTNEQKRSWVKELLIECPTGNPLDNCPLWDLRALPNDERLKFADGMDESHLDVIISYHRQCLYKRTLSINV